MSELFDSIMKRTEPNDNPDSMVSLKDEIRRMQRREKQRRLHEDATHEELDQFADEEEEHEIRMKQRKEYEESEKIRVEAINSEYINKQHLRTDLVLYVDGKKTPFQKGLGIKCPHCGKDHAFSSFSEHLKLHMIRERNNDEARHIKAHYGLVMCRAPEMPFACQSCKKYVTVTLMSVPKGE